MNRRGGATRRRGRPRRRSGVLAECLGTLAASCVLGSCADENQERNGSSGNPAGLFHDVTDTAGLQFVHENGASGQKFLVETNGSGAAWLDRQGDGRLDLVLIQGAPLPGFVGDPSALHDVLYDQTETGRFRDATEESRWRSRGHGMAAAAPDIDDDGDSDLFVTRFGRDSLFENDGLGHFEEVTARTELGASDTYHSSCVFADFDRDGDLDLWVVGYVDFRIEENPPCGDTARGPEYRTYCSPDMFAAVDDLLYENDGAGSFRDVSEAAGLRGSGGKGLGVVVADVDDDGDLDVFVANDSDVNHLWRNQGALRFVECGSELCVDYNGQGRTEACMGCDFGDVDEDGDLDLFTVNLANETNTLWVREGESFHDRSGPSGLGTPSTAFVGFGTALADLDRDGLLDVVVANGHVLDNAERVNPQWTHAQRPHLYRGDGKGRFELLPAALAGDFFEGQYVGRALALADYDDDGDLDLLVTQNHGRAHLVENRSDRRVPWVGLRLIGTHGPRDAVGAAVVLEQPCPGRTRRVRGGGSYLSDHDRRVLFALPAGTRTVTLGIHWPSGGVQRIESLEVGRYHTVQEPD